MAVLQSLRELSQRCSHTVASFSINRDEYAALTGLMHRLNLDNVFLNTIFECSVSQK
jgi:hypothetical protein